MSKPDWVEYEVPADGNVFLALGFPPEKMNASSQRPIAISRKTKP